MKDPKDLYLIFNHAVGEDVLGASDHELPGSWYPTSSAGVWMVGKKLSGIPYPFDEISCCFGVILGNEFDYLFQIL